MFLNGAEKSKDIKIFNYQKWSLVTKLCFSSKNTPKIIFGVICVTMLHNVSRVISELKLKNSNFFIFSNTIFTFCKNN